ncbi:MAG: hypothetical protein HN995_00885 [Candidatus Marinimicrobia bacterium]|jgi:hypothetical protein|nr:hypothetical protein [Candidatus Neomarinimicrobiota bacterium]MBT3576966.1 hypothetical protein [Candidatus Neomarinimicrobiota bacterium]MBT3680431.1 hypothetical protein [Candidatus Neomarinimicrobiota bacterium]MBT3951347.1 hypothetical protein [Candidatus Neomarinimicrobiota bacterium]MBT4254035.1 hypothetical protein [Candidatus Neomarinimicrobiota bacterium]
MYLVKFPLKPTQYHRVVIALFLLMGLFSVNLDAGDFDASVAPKSRFLLRINPNIYFTSAHFLDNRKPANLDTVTGLLSFEMPIHIQYGLTGALSIGAIIPPIWTYQEIDPEIRYDPIHRFAIRDIWLTIQHRWLAIPFVSSSSIRIKIPISKKKDWEDGLRIGDGQVDIFPLYYIDYYSKRNYWYSELTVGYKFRLKQGDIKPLDEFHLKTQLGYELLPSLQVRFFLYAGIIDFRNGQFGDNVLEFYQKDGDLRTFGYGVSLWPRPSLRLEIATGGDWFGRNQYRGMRWLISIAKII